MERGSDGQVRSVCTPAGEAQRTPSTSYSMSASSPITSTILCGTVALSSRQITINCDHACRWRREVHSAVEHERRRFECGGRTTAVRNTVGDITRAKYPCNAQRVHVRSRDFIECGIVRPPAEPFDDQFVRGAAPAPRLTDASTRASTAGATNSDALAGVECRDHPAAMRMTTPPSVSATQSKRREWRRCIVCGTATPHEQRTSEEL
jgi:hypothetical protein